MPITVTVAPGGKEEKALFQAVAQDIDLHKAGIAVQGPLLFDTNSTIRPVPSAASWCLVPLPNSAHAAPFAASLLSNGTSLPKALKLRGSDKQDLLLASGLPGASGPSTHPVPPAAHAGRAPTLWLGVVSRARAAAAPHDTMLAMTEGEHPSVCVLRDACFAASCMSVARQLLPHRPFSAATKTGRSMRRDNTLMGMQGIVARWLFAKFLSDVTAAPAAAGAAASGAGSGTTAGAPGAAGASWFQRDVFLPSPPTGASITPDKNVIAEFEQLGVPAEAAQAAEGLMRSAFLTAARTVRAHAASNALPAGWTDTSAGVSALVDGDVPVTAVTAQSLRACVLPPVHAEGATEPLVRLRWRAAQGDACRKVRLDMSPASVRLPLTLPLPFDLEGSVASSDDGGGTPWRGGVLPYAPDAGGSSMQLPGEVTLSLRQSHYAKLRALVARRLAAGGASEGAWAAAAARLHTLMFRCLARYETLSGNSSGFQGAVTCNVFDVLTRLLGVTCEGFASPLNCYLPRFCSLFPDVDRPFGSLGSFFNQQWKGGGVEVNPPFVNATLQAAWERMREQLAAAEAGGEALQFVFITPGWGDARWAVDAKASSYCTAVLQPGLGEHQYRDGTQWRAQRLVWSANTSSFYFFLQSPAAQAARRMSAQLQAALESQLGANVAHDSIPLLQPVDVKPYSA